MKPNYLRWRLNLYPPYFGTGIHVTHIADDFRRIVVEMKLRWYNPFRRQPIGDDRLYTRKKWG